MAGGFTVPFGNDVGSAAGRYVNLTTLTLSAHTGSHADAPRHFTDDGLMMEQVDLRPYWGSALVITVSKAAGPSGSGKSSLALYEQAELLLNDDERQRCILLVDQFEEIFTQTKDENVRVAFINLLTTAAQIEGGRCQLARFECWG